MSTWPSTLPIPQMAGYDVEATDPTARTDMDSGPARVRRRFTAAPDKVSLSFIMDEAQMIIFRAFWETDFLSGAAWVYMPIRDGIAAGMSSKECRPSAGKFKASPVSSSHWNVSFDVEVRSA